MKIILQIVLVLLLSIIVNPEARAETINPQTYHSLENNYSLFVDPSSRDGISSAQYTFSENNHVLWSKTLDQTFVEVKISSEGHIFGYSYSLGLAADYYIKRKGKPNTLTLWMISNQGEVVFKQIYERGMEVQPAGQHDRPICKGIVLQEATNTVSFRLTPNRKNIHKMEHWQQFNVSTGERKTDLFIDFKNQAHYKGGLIESILAIPNTAYYLLELRQHVSEESVVNSQSSNYYLSDSLFYLMNSDGDVVWRDVNLGDLRFEYNSKAGRQWDQYLDHHALINYDASINQFSIQHIKDQEIIFYGINDDSQVTEKSRKPLKPFTQDHSKSNTEPKQPKYLYTIELEKESQKAKLPARFSAFAINENNQFGTLVKSSGTLYFLVISENGQILQKVPITADSKGYQITSVVAKNNSTWLFLMGNVKKNSRLFEINVESSQLTEISIDAPGGGRMVVHDNENITVLATESGDYLRQFDKQGNTLWTFHEEDYDEPGYLLSPADITLSGDGEIIVHDSTRGQLNYFSSDGKFIKKIEFKNTSKGELNYAGLLLVIGDVIYIEDQDDSTIIHSYSMDGKWLDEHTLQQTNGKKLNHIRDMQADSAGNIWVADGGLFQFDASFNHSKYIGQTQQQQLFNNISTMQTNSKGDIYLLNEESYSVIKILAKDKRQKVFSIPADQIPNRSPSKVNMFIGNEDQIYVKLGECKHSVFSAEGTYLKEIKSALNCGEYDHIDLISHPNQNTYWREEDDKITLEKYHSNENQVLKTITKDSNGHWLNNVADLVTDKTGRLVAIGNRSSDLRKQDRVIYIFDENGQPLSTIPVQDYVSSLAIAGDYIYLNYSKEQKIRVLNIDGQQVGTFMNQNTKKEDCKTTMLHADESNNKLLIFDGKSISVFELLK